MRWNMKNVRDHSDDAAVTPHVEFAIELPERIAKLGAEPGDVLLLRPGHPRPFALTRFVAEDRVLDAWNDITPYLSADLIQYLRPRPRHQESPRGAGRPHARPRASLRLLRVDD